MEQYPAIGRRNVQFLTDFCGFHPRHFAQAENLRHGRLQAVGAFVQHPPQLTQLGLGMRVAPWSDRLGPVAVLFEQAVDRLIAIRIARELDFPYLLADQINNLVLENTGQPGARATLEAGAQSDNSSILKQDVFPICFIHIVCQAAA
jgi:hypothetical protein